MDRVQKVVRKPRAARREVAEKFELIEWEDLQIAPKTREMLAEITRPRPDYTAIAEMVLAMRQQIEAERRVRRRQRDEKALMALMGWST